MAVTHSDTRRNANANGVGTALANGKFTFLTAADAVLATIVFGATAFDTAPATAVGIITANATTAETNAAAGTATKCELQTSGDVMVVAFAIADGITISSAVFAEGDQVALSTFTYEAAA